MSSHTRPANATSIYVTDSDRRRLGLLLATREGRAWGSSRGLGKLEATLEDAEPVESSRTPETLVTMNTTVKLTDLGTGQPRTVTLVYPDDVDLVPDGISVFKALGTALIGHKVGDVVESAQQHVRRKLIVAKIVFQPEKAGVDYL